MKSRFLTTKFDSYIPAVILSANDVVATVLILHEDEGYTPITIAEVSLPYQARDYRQSSKDGKSMFQRGDKISIRCKVTKEKHKFKDSFIDELLFSLMDIEDDNAELFSEIDRRSKEFALEWEELCMRDLEKRSKCGSLEGNNK